MTKFSRIFTTALLATGAICSTVAAARPMTAEDIATLDRMGSVTVFPDEKWVAFDATETDPESEVED